MDIPTAAQTFKKHLRYDNDNVIAVTSAFEGMGKSTFLILLCKAIDPNWNMSKQLLINPEVKDLVKLILGEDEHGTGKLPKYSAIGLDEAISIVYKLDWYQPESKFINKLFIKARKENLAYVFAMPRFTDFNEIFRNHKIRIWVHLLDRGLGVAFKKDDGASVRDPWFLKESEKIWVKNVKSVVHTSIERKMEVYKKFRNFLCFVEFPDLDDVLKPQYIKLRDQFKYSDVKFGSEKRNEQEWDRAKEIMSLPILKNSDGQYSRKRVEGYYGIGNKKADRLLGIVEILKQQQNPDNLIKEPELPPSPVTSSNGAPNKIYPDKLTNKERIDKR